MAKNGIGHHNHKNRRDNGGGGKFTDILRNRSAPEIPFGQPIEEISAAKTAALIKLVTISNTWIVLMDWVMYVLIVKSRLVTPITIPPRTPKKSA